MRWRLPRIRLRLRTLMIAVAIVAFFLEMADRSRRFSAIADLHSGTSMASVTKPEEVRELQLWNAYNRAMCRKYSRAARYPWLPVWSDPPAPWPVDLDDGHPAASARTLQERRIFAQRDAYDRTMFLLKNRRGASAPWPPVEPDPPAPE